MTTTLDRSVAMPLGRESPEVPGRRSSVVARLLVGTALAAGLLQSVIGVAWWIANLSAVPAYGDTTEYLDLAEGLRVDGYRTLAYPVLVRIALEISGWTGLGWQVPLYLVQTSVLVVAVGYLVRTVAPMLSRARVALAIAIVATSPLPLHYAATVLTDSLSASLFVVALAGFARIVIQGDRSRSTVAVVAAATVGAGLVRSEKSLVMVLFAGAAVLLVGVVRARRGRAAVPGGSYRGIAVATVLAVILPAVVATVVNRATQTADFGRPPLSAQAIAVNRLVWPHLAEIRDELPADARAGISAVDAATFDSHNNQVMPMLQRMRDIDGGGDRIIDAAIRAALECCAAAVAVDTAKDATEYAFAPVTFLREGATVLLHDGPEPHHWGWNVTRMNAAHPTLTTVWLVVSWTTLVLLVVSAAVALVRRRLTTGRRGDRRTLMLTTVWLGTVLNGCFFAASQGADANLRYAVATAVALTAALVVRAVPEAISPRQLVRSR